MSEISIKKLKNAMSKASSAIFLLLSLIGHNALALVSIEDELDGMTITPPPHNPCFTLSVDKGSIEVHEESCAHGTHCATFQPELNTTVHLAVPTLNLDHIDRVTLEGRNFRNGGPIFVTGEECFLKSSVRAPEFRLQYNGPALAYDFPK